MKIKNIIRLLLAPLLLCVFALSASAQVTDSTRTNLTGLAATVATTATSNHAATVSINTGDAVALSWRFNQSAASTSNCTLNVYSVIGTNISTSPFAQIIAAATGVTDVVAQTNWTPDQLRGIDQLRVGGIANTTALTTLTNKAVYLRITR
jgi:hypothetical protein